MANPRRKPEPIDDDEDDGVTEYNVAPLDPNVRTREPMLFGPPYDGYFHEEPPEPVKFQFSLADLMLLVTAVAVCCSMIKVIPGGRNAVNFAGVTGLAVLICMAVLRSAGVTRPIIRVGWWVGLCLYFTACFMAIILG